MQRIFFLFLLLNYSCLNLFAQDEVSKDDIITALKSVRTKVVAITSPTSSQNEKIQAIKSKINFAILNIDKDPDKFPKAYLQSLEQLSAFAEYASQDSVDKNHILDVIAKDLELKFSKPPDKISSTSYIKLVKVSVMTRKGAEPVKNLRVHYNGLGYAIDYAAPSHSFQGVTGPLKDNLVPGYYVLWATKDSDLKMLGKITIEIDPTRENNIIIIVQ